MPKKRERFLHLEVSRHGTTAWYFRRGKGSRVRIRAAYDSAEFLTEYAAALQGAPKTSTLRKVDTLEWSLDLYRQSSAWAGLSNATRRQSENIYKSVIKTAGHELLGGITADTIISGRERRSKTPHAANNFLKSMRRFFAWASGDGKLVKIDPTAGVKMLKGANDEAGFHVWSEDELARFEARWPVGTRERLAFDFLLYSGLRRGDVVRVGRQHVRNGEITIRTEKHAHGKMGIEVTIPILGPLAKSIAATKTGALAYLVTEAGQPWVKESFGNWFRNASREAGCPGSAHGLRKAGATRAADRGATERQLMAIFGWSSWRMASHYTRSADRKRAGRDAAALLLPVHVENEKSRTIDPGAGIIENNVVKSG
jgi:integrase